MKPENKKDKKNSRSSGYPVFSLEDCVSAVKMVKQGLGMSFSSRDLIAQAMGYSGVTGASGTKISACVHFGLLNRSGNTYAVSELSGKVLTPVSENEKAMALVEAVSSPSLYKKLITEYDGRALPKMLENILCREYGIIENSAKKATDIFKRSLEYAGLLQNGVVRSFMPRDDKGTSSESVSHDEDVDNSTVLIRDSAGSGALMMENEDSFTINLLDTGAKLLIPNDFSYDVSIGELAQEIKSLGEKLEMIQQKHKRIENEESL